MENYNLYEFNSLNVSDISYNNHAIKTQHIFILAGGQIKNGDVNSWVKERLDIGKILYDKNKDSVIYCIGGGTYHKPPTCNKFGHVIHESTSCSNYLIENGVDCNKIKREWGSYDTIANGFFSFTNFILPLKIKECVLITSEFHMERVKEIFDYFKILFSQDINITYITSENNMDNELLNLRKNREKQSVESFKKNIVDKIKTVDEFIEWFYVEHNAYNCRDYIKDSESDNIKGSY